MLAEQTAKLEELKARRGDVPGERKSGLTILSQLAK
jgi:hypothetical protein